MCRRGTALALVSKPSERNTEPPKMALPVLVCVPAPPGVFLPVLAKLRSEVP